MNQTNLSSLFLPLLLVSLAVAAIVNMLAQGGNQIGNSFFLLMLFGSALGLFTPRAGLLVFLVFQFYIDFFKRLMILGDSLSTQDVITSLAMGPVVIIMACMTCTVQCLTGKVPFSKVRDLIYFGGCVGVSLLGLFMGGGAASSGGFADTAQSLLGTSMVGMTAYATYVLVRDQMDLHKVLKYLVIGAVPMAFYTFLQAFNGISGWEETYIRTGYSKVLYNFYLVGGIDGMRPFSTLNTHTSLGAVSAIMFLLAAFVMTRAKRFFGVPKEYRVFYVVVALLFLGSCYLSKNRTTYLVPILGPMLIFLFSGGWRTLAFYLLSFSAFIGIVANSEFLHGEILNWTLQFEKTGVGAKFGSLGTYQDRLKGYMNLADGSNWTPFGLNENVRPFVHDQISEALITLGYIPLLAILLTGASLAFWWHRRCLRISNPDERLFMITLTAIIVSLTICGLAYGNLLFVAPVNSLLGVMIGLGMATLRRDQVEKRTALRVAHLPQEILQPPARLALQRMKVRN